MRNSDHFDIEAWTDFARGLDSPGRHQELQAHLDSGCTQCVQTADFLVQVARAGRQMAGVRAPEEWSRKAEQIIRNELLDPIRKLPVQRAVPAFDSFRMAEPVEVRTGSRPSRLLVYEAMGCTVELKLEESEELRELSIVGQITDRRLKQAIAATPVFLLHGKKLVAKTSSNTFGEFQLACRFKRNILISFPFQGARIDVMLDRPSAGES